MLKVGTRVVVLHSSWEGEVGVIKGKIRIPKYPRGFRTGYIVKVGRDTVSLEPTLIRKITA